MVLVAAAFVAVGGRAAAQDRLVQEGRDPVTGATVRVYRAAGGPRIDVETGNLHLRKQVVGDKITTSLTGGGESLVIELDKHVFTVAGTHGRARATPEDQTGLARARQLVAESPLAVRAAALIGKMGFGETSPLQPLLLTTRAFLLAASEDDSGARELAEWVRNARTRVQVIKTGGQRTPSDCWREYANEIVDAFTDYADCVTHLTWWDIFGETRCAVVYEVRILGAFTWYMGCASVGSFIGG